MFQHPTYNRIHCVFRVSYVEFRALGLGLGLAPPLKSCVRTSAAKENVEGRWRGGGGGGKGK